LDSLVRMEFPKSRVQVGNVTNFAVYARALNSSLEPNDVTFDKRYHSR
jgi:hypothetical protein